MKHQQNIEPDSGQMISMILLLLFVLILCVSRQRAVLAMTTAEPQAPAVVQP
jgi:hypothetical protein